MRRIIASLSIATAGVLGVTVMISTVTSAPATASKSKHHKKKTKPKSSHPAKTTTTTAASQTTANFNSCSVVTQAQAASALGSSVTAGILGNATVEGGLACVFYGPSVTSPTTPNVAQSDSVRVVVVKGSDALTWYDDYKSKVSPQAISGYGTQAFYDGYASLSVLKGDYYLRVAVAPSSAPPSLTAEEQLATAILPRL
jgi:hypothetical protein